MGMWTPSNTWFLGPTRVLKQNIISIASVVFAEMGDRLATIDIGRKLGAVPFGEMGPHVTQCGLGRGLPSCQVAS